MGVHAGLPVPALTRGAPGLAQSGPVVGDLLGPVLVELPQAVGEGAGAASITVAGSVVALTQDHLHWPGPGLGGGRQGGRLQAAQLVQTVCSTAVQPAAVTSLQPHRAQVSLLSRLDRGRPHSSHLPPPRLLVELEVVLSDGSQLGLTWTSVVFYQVNTATFTDLPWAN